MSETYNSFVFYKEWLNQLRVIATGGDWMDMVSLCDGLNTFLEGKEPEDLTPLAMLVYNQMTAQIERDKGTYKEVSEKRSEAGKKGAEARWGEAKDGKPMANDGKTWQTMANDSLKDDDDVDDDVSPKGDVCIVGAEPIIGLPLNDGSEHPVTSEDIAEYSRLYPAVDVMQELRDMRGWLLANPTRRKTKRGVKAFIRTWLSKEQDKPVARSGTTSRKLTAEDLINLPTINPWSEAVT